MPEHNEQDRFATLLRDSILMLCKSGFSGSSCVASVQGLLGITLNDRHIFLISVNEILQQHHITTETINDSLLCSPLVKTEKHDNVGIIHSDADDANSTSIECESFQTSGSNQVVNLHNVVARSQCITATMNQQTFSSQQVSPSCSTRRHAASGSVKAEEDVVFHSEKDCEKDTGGVTNRDIDENSDALEMKEEISVSSTDSDNLMSEELFDPNAPPPESFWSSRSRGALAIGADGQEQLPLSPHNLHPAFNSASSYANLTSLQYDDIAYNASGSFMSSSSDNFDLMQNAQRRYGSGNVDRKKRYMCYMCSYTSNRSYNLVRHVIRRHTSADMQCPECSFLGVDREQLRCHWLDVHAQDHGVPGSLRLSHGQIHRRQIP